MWVKGLHETEGAGSKRASKGSVHVPSPTTAGIVRGKQWGRKSERETARESSGLPASHALTAHCDSQWLSPDGRKQRPHTPNVHPAHGLEGGYNEACEHSSDTPRYHPGVPPTAYTHPETLIKPPSRQSAGDPGVSPSINSWMALGKGLIVSWF